ncbi:MAG: fluoride efflux transporter CrcB [Gammaproteobacteria bacterium]|nr:fluoride efflux transporter CrcB [Gammaproteobacteria bacterium]MDE2071008.1 fluoride efflux transporter CrcB [Gammaproteobacteria bacterium]
MNSVLWTYVAVAVGGAIGCCARLGVTQEVQTIYGRDFPLATLVINVLGCLLVGFVFFATLERLNVSPMMRAAIITGGLGGFTTFSTFAMESLLLIENGETARAVLYLALSVGLGLTAAFTGAYIARSL